MVFGGFCARTDAVVQKSYNRWDFLPHFPHPMRRAVVNHYFLTTHNDPTLKTRVVKILTGLWFLRVISLHSFFTMTKQQFSYILVFSFFSAATDNGVACHNQQPTLVHTQCWLLAMFSSHTDCAISTLFFPFRKSFLIFSSFRGTLQLAEF